MSTEGDWVTVPKEELDRLLKLEAAITQAWPAIWKLIQPMWQQLVATARDAGFDVPQAPGWQSLTYEIGERRIRELSAWIDTAEVNADRDPEAATWGRLAKVAEEGGEVIRAFIGATGQNPRKGVTNDMGPVELELFDVAVTALCAVAHVRGNRDTANVMLGLYDHIDRTHARAGLGQTES